MSLSFDKLKLLLVIFALTLFSYSVKSQKFTWPDTPAGKTYQDFLRAYNSGSKERVKVFVYNYYFSENKSFLDQEAERWIDLYQRLGEAAPYSISIDQPYDLELWLQGSITKTWFAPELILDKESMKIKAAGLLMGEKPNGVEEYSKNESEFVDKIEKYLKSNSEEGYFQGTVQVFKNNQMLLSKAYGYKNIKTKELNTTATRMRISSINKMITAIAVLQLAQEGKISIYKSIDSYLPELPENIASKITPYQLLTHTSNYELDGIDGFRDKLEAAGSIKEVYEIHLNYLPKWEKFNDFSTGSRFDYSNDSYDLLAMIVEMQSGMLYQDYIKNHIFLPLDMLNTSFDYEDAATPYRYDFYKDEISDVESKYPFSLGKISGAGGLISTGDDLNKLMNGILYNNELLNLSFRSLLISPLVYRGGGDYYGTGVTISFDDSFNIGHNGTGIGNSAELRYFPDLGYTLVVLCNNRSGAQNFYNFFKNNLPLDKS